MPDNPLMIPIDTPRGPYTLLFWGSAANRIRILKSMHGDHIIEKIIEKVKEQHFSDPEPFNFTPSPIW